MNNNNKQILILLGGILFLLTSLGWIGISHGAKEIRKSPTARLVKIDSQDLKDRWRVIIETSQPVLFTKKILSSPHGLVVDLTPCVLDKSQPFTFNINAPWFEGFKYFQFNQKTVRIVFNFSQASDPLISPMEGKPYQLFINFPKIQAQSTQPIPPKEEEETLPPKNVEEFKKEKTILDSQFKKREAESQKARVTFDFYMTNLHNVVRLIADVGGINVVFGDDIKEGKDAKEKERKVTLSLKEVPWDEALDSILEANNLIRKSYGEKTFLIISRENYLKLINEERKIENKNRVKEIENQKFEELQQKGEKYVEREKFFQLKNIDVILVLKLLEEAEYKQFLKGGKRIDVGFLETASEQADIDVSKGSGTASGTSSASGIRTQSTARTTPPTLFLLKIPHTNSILARGIKQDLEFIEKLIKAIDQPVSQVMIEARIIEADANYTRDLGIRWGGAFPFANASGPFAGTIRGGDAGATSAYPTNNYAVNLPFTTATSAFGGLGFSFASTNFNLDVRLQAMEKEGRGKTISSPKVLTRDNSKAIIKQGQSIPVTTRTENNTFSTTYRDAALTLTVTPSIASDKRIRIKIEITKNEPDFTKVDSLGNPTIKTKEASTEMMINDGNTVIIGGIMYKKESLNENKIPGLADIPFLGWLFKTRYKATEDTEMLIFITPKILKSSLSERFNEDTN